MTKPYEHLTPDHKQLDNETLYQRLIETNSNLQRYLNLAPSLSPTSSSSLPAKRPAVEYSQLPMVLHAMPRSRSASTSK